MGAAINNGNMGCLALTYSLAKLLDSINKELLCNFEYVFFDMIPDEKSVMKMCTQIGMRREKIKIVRMGSYSTYISRVKNFSINRKMKQEIKRCDVIIDITAGDSFTDIYGKKRFYSWTYIKNMIEKLGIPLILGPQTYGPFRNEKNREYAKTVIDQARAVITRDKLSTQYLESFTSRKILTTIDLAFLLPYTKKTFKSRDKIRIGFNISSLLVSDKQENTEVDFDLRLNYDQYVEDILNWFVKNNDKYEVFLVPHVQEDYDTIKKYKEKYSDFNYCQMFSSPIEAKNFISSLDIFIGARMHATIAAISSGVVTIPTAYSRKFKGVFDELGYQYIIDLQTLNEREALEKTIKYIKSQEKLKDDVKDAQNIIIERNEYTKVLFYELFKEYKN